MSQKNLNLKGGNNKNNKYQMMDNITVFSYIL